MSRFAGQALPPHISIAVVANDAIGNFVVITPLLQMLRSQFHPSTIDLFSGPRTHELQVASSLIDECYDFLGDPPGFLEAHRRQRYDLVINVERTPWAMSVAGLLMEGRGLVCGPSMNPNGRGELPFANDWRGQLWEDPEWTSPQLLERYPELDSPFIGAIFCRLCYLEGEVPAYCVPETEPACGICDVLISTAASLPNKIWAVDKWVETLKWIDNRGLTVGLIGAKPSEQAAHWQGVNEENRLLKETKVIDLRGTLSLPEVAGALKRAKFVLTVDNGIMHLGAAVHTPTIALFRSGIDRLWLPPTGSVKAIVAQEGSPVSQISVREVLEALEHEL